jgi:hypothetical protein
MATRIAVKEQVAPRGRYTAGRRASLPKPRWGLLYALGLLGGLVLIAGETLFGSAGWRGVWDLATVGATLGAIGGWVSANRIALALEGGAAITAEAPEDTVAIPVRSYASLTVSKRAA